MSKNTLFVIVTIPSWPGEGEAIHQPGKWDADRRGKTRKLEKTKENRWIMPIIRDK
jgi:hypothetical protein